MQAWEAIQTAVDTIEENLPSDIRIVDLAQKAALSPYYFQRLFARLVGRPVREYIRLRRLAKASGMLRKTKRRIADIALDCGFASHEALSRAFKDAYGVTPVEYRGSKLWLNQFQKPCLGLQYEEEDENVPLMAGEIVVEMRRKRLQKPRHFFGLSCTVAMGEQLPLGEITGINLPGSLWEEFHEKKSGIPGLAPDGNELGVSYLENAPAGCFQYFAGKEAEEDAPCPKGYEEYILPAVEYVLCCFEAETVEELVNETLYRAIEYAGLWMERHGIQTGDFAAEMYYWRNKAADGYYMETWMPVSL